jgi:hypothetical protein
LISGVIEPDAGSGPAVQTKMSREEGRSMAFDLVVWSSPRDLDADAAGALVRGWLDAGGDPAASPFEASTDIGWFVRELRSHLPDIDVVSDAVPTASSRPVWLATDPEPAARVAAVRLARDGRVRDELESIFGLATKYDLIVYEPGRHRVTRPMQVMADHASATFWPRGAIQAGVAGAVGLVLAAAGWLLPIPIVGWILILVGGFLFAMAVFTFVHEGRASTARSRDQRNGGGT